MQVVVCNCDLKTFLIGGAMNHGFGIFDANRDNVIDRGQFCHSNFEEDDMLDKIDRKREKERAAKLLKRSQQQTTAKGMQAQKDAPATV